MNLRVYGNRPLKTLPGLETRPTPARVREALFNIWQGDIEGCCWLDLCSGIGAMGAEALCRGAAQVVGIEQSARACAVVTANWKQLAQPEQTVRLIRGDVVKKIATLHPQSFDRIYFDPPYASDLYEPVLLSIQRDRLLSAEGELAMEHAPKHWNRETWSAFLGQVYPLQVCRQKVYGNTAVTFFRWADDPARPDSPDPR